jgi:hypothetical protein
MVGDRCAGVPSARAPKPSRGGRETSPLDLTGADWVRALTICATPTSSRGPRQRSCTRAGRLPSSRGAHRPFRPGTGGPFRRHRVRARRTARWRPPRGSEPCRTPGRRCGAASCRGCRPTTSPMQPRPSPTPSSRCCMPPPARASVSCANAARARRRRPIPIVTPPTAGSTANGASAAGPTRRAHGIWRRGAPPTQALASTRR